MSNYKAVSYIFTEEDAESGLSTGLRGVEERADEEGEGNGRETVHKEQAKDGSEVGSIEQAAHREQCAKEGKHEAQNNTVRDEVTCPIREVRKTHHAHGLLEATALLEHYMYHNALNEDPEGEGNNERLQCSISKEGEHRIHQNHEYEE